MHSSPRHGLWLDQGAPRPLQANYTLHQRSEAETLLMEFSRAQMTRHYWCEFAGSLHDLGLSVGLQLLAKVVRDAVRTWLWIEPHHRTEA